MRELTVREARSRRGLTQAELADASGVDQTTISDLETGRHTNPRVGTVARLAKALGIAPSRLRFADAQPSQSVAKANDRVGQSDRPTRQRVA